MMKIRRDKKGYAHICFLSGGKDSTAMALRLKEVSPELKMNYICTPTGDELPDMVQHLNKLELLLGQRLYKIITLHDDGSVMTLNSLIEKKKTLPNWQRRFCTRQLKIEPALKFMKNIHPAVMYVGLRADEETRQGLFDENIEVRYPMRDWSWTIKDVQEYLRSHGITIPRRTDCARCYAQKLVEWKVLSEIYPEIYEDAIRQEREIGHTFRHPSKGKWPTSLYDLREAFRSGRKIRGEDKYRAQYNL